MTMEASIQLTDYYFIEKQQFTLNTYFDMTIIKSYKVPNPMYMTYETNMD